MTDRLKRFIIRIDKRRFTGAEVPASTLVVLGLSVLVLGFGIVYSLMLGDTMRYYDERLYLRLAHSLVETHTYSFDGVTPSAYRPPGYNLSLYPVFWLGGGMVHVRIVQYVLLALSILLLHYLLRLWSYPAASVMAGLAVFAYPVLFYTASTLYPQTVTAFTFLLVCVAVVRPDTHVLQWFWGGLVFGVLLLMTPIFLVLLPLLLSWPWLLKMRHRMWANIVLICAVLMVLTPWLVRNYRAFDQFVFVSANSGLMLVMGNSDETRPNAGSSTDVSKHLKHTRSQGMNQIDEDKYFRSQAIQWIMSHRLEAVKLYVLKLLSHFHFRNELASKAENTWTRDLVMFVTYYTLLGLAAWRIASGQWWRARPFEGFAFVSYLLMGAAYAIFFTRVRYRLPLDWLLLALAAIALSSLLRVDSDDALDGPTLSSRELAMGRKALDG